MALFMSLDPQIDFLDLLGYVGRGSIQHLESNEAHVAADMAIDEFELYIKGKNSYLKDVAIKGREDLVSTAAFALAREFKAHPGEPGIAAGLVIAFAMTCDRLRESV